MIDAPDLEDRVRRTFTAIADSVPETANPDLPWSSDAARPLVRAADEGVPHADERGTRRVATAGAAALVLAVTVVAGFVLARPTTPDLDRVLSGDVEEPTTAAPPTTELVRPPEGQVAVSVWAAHDGSVTGDFVDLWSWDDHGSSPFGSGPSGPTSDIGPGGWRPMYLHLPVAQRSEDQIDAHGLHWSIVTFHVPPKAAQHLVAAAMTVGLTTSTAPPSCAPRTPGCDEVRAEPPFSLDELATDAPVPGPGS